MWASPSSCCIESGKSELRRLGRIFFAFISFGFLPSASAHDMDQRSASADPVQAVRAVMSTPDDKVDFARAKLTFDKLYDPSTDIEAQLKQIDHMVHTIGTMAGPSASSRLRLIALHKFLYEAGSWNDNVPFAYDMTDPRGHKPASQLLSKYIRMHRGNCVSMPVLFIALAQRLGLKATLSTVPDHVFAKYTDDATGRTLNLETTRAAVPVTDDYYLKNIPMTDAAIANGIYMKTLSKKEALVVMATEVLDSALMHRRFREILDLVEVLRPYYPNDLAVLLMPADAGIGMLDKEFRAKYPKRTDVPPELLGRLGFLERSVDNALNHAYALGWRESDGADELALQAATTAPK
ncbi:MAG TPA: transglutaminase family protein [Rhizomicrobium sp.]|nr:transglutaminase family protein [Rhizomicrobium sp.]